MKNYLRKKVKKLYDNGIEFNEIPYELFGHHNVSAWPEVLITSDDDEDEIGDKEELDLENFEWLSIDDDELEICCGGDWQEPMKLILQLSGNKLVVVDVEDNYFEDGLSENEFNEILNL